MSDPTLNIDFKDSTGKTIAPTVSLRIQEGLSPRLAKALIRELGHKKINAALDAALPALGFK
jgi:hypothetical protein